MLKLTVVSRDGRGVGLQAEGQIVGELGTLLEQEALRLLSESDAVTLDLGEVSYADQPGLAILRRLSQRLQLVRTPPLIAALLHSEEPGMSAPQSDQTLRSRLPMVINPAFRLALLLTGSGPAAEALLADAVPALAAQAAPAEAAPFRAWFLGQVVAAFLQQLRRQDDGPGSRARHEARMASLDEEHPARDLLSRLDVTTLSRAMQAVSPENRGPLALSALEQMSTEDLARQLDCPVTTVAARLHRGRRQLRAALCAAAGSSGTVAA